MNKYAPGNGALLWSKNWGVTGDDFPVDMGIDNAGDIYVTGTGIDFINKYSTIKLRGTDGQLLWQFYDAIGQRHSARALYLDGAGGVFITGTSDPDGDVSNFNDCAYGSSWLLSAENAVMSVVQCRSERMPPHGRNSQCGYIRPRSHRQIERKTGTL